MKRGLTSTELAARIAARDAERDRKAMIAADRREELLALSEVTVAYKTGAICDDR